jgi:hypothetical protein
MNQSDRAIIDDIIGDAKALLKRCQQHGLAWSVYNVSVVIDGLNLVEALAAPIVEDDLSENDKP